MKTDILTFINQHRHKITSQFTNIYITCS